MNPNQPNPPINPYANPYAPGPEQNGQISGGGAFQPSAQPYGQPAAPSPYGAPAPQNPYYGSPNTPQQPYGAPQPPAQPNPYVSNPQPDMTQQAPIPQMQSPMMGYNPYPYPGEFETQKRGPNKFILGVIAVVVIVGTIFGALALNSNSGGNGSQNNPGITDQNSSTDQNSNKDVMARTDGKLDLSSKINTNDTLKQQTLQGSLNDQINLSSGFSFMTTAISPYASSGSSTPAAGKRFIVINAVVGNRTASSNISVSYLDFRLRGENNALMAPHAATNEIVNNQLSNPTELKPGEQLTGKIVFEVGENESTWGLQHTETYQKTTDNTTFDVTGEVSLTLTRASNTGTPDPQASAVQ